MSPGTCSYGFKPQKRQSHYSCKFPYGTLFIAEYPSGYYTQQNGLVNDSFTFQNELTNTKNKLQPPIFRKIYCKNHIIFDTKMHIRIIKVNIVENIYKPFSFTMRQ